MEKIKTVTLTVKPYRQVMNEFAETLGKAMRGEKIKPRREISFETLDVMRTVLTKRRLELMSIIKHDKPESIYALSKLLKRDLKSVNTDLSIMKSNGFIELEKIKKGRHRTIPKVNFDNITITVDV